MSKLLLCLSVARLTLNSGVNGGWRPFTQLSAAQRISARDVHIGGPGQRPLVPGRVRRPCAWWWEGVGRGALVSSQTATQLLPASSCPEGWRHGAVVGAGVGLAAARCLCRAAFQRLALPPLTSSLPLVSSGRCPRCPLLPGRLHELLHLPRRVPAAATALCRAEISLSHQSRLPWQCTSLLGSQK